MVRRGKEWTQGVIVESCNRPRSYKIKVGKNVLERNRKFLIKNPNLNNSFQNVFLYDDDCQSHKSVVEPQTKSPERLLMSRPNNIVSPYQSQTKTPVKSPETVLCSPRSSRPNSDLRRESPAYLRNRYGRLIKPPRRLNW